MALLNIGADISVDETIAAAGSGNRRANIPDGRYSAIVLDSELKTTTAGGQRLVLKVVVTQGAHADTVIEDSLNIVNENETAVMIAMRKLALLAKACGFSTIPQDSAALHNKPVQIVVKSKTDKYVDKNTGEHKTSNPYSVIDSYEPAGGAVAAGQPAFKPAVAQAAPAAAAVPWKK